MAYHESVLSTATSQPVKLSDPFEDLLGSRRGAERPGASTVVKNHNGLEFTVRIVERGERYGNGAVNDGERLVAVYDRRYAGAKFTRWGQQTGVWPLSSVLAHSPRTVWMLYGDVQEWTLDADAADRALQFLRGA